MAYTRKQVVTCLSIVYLIFLTALAGYATARALKLSIPISDALSGFATALPILAGLMLEAGYDLTRYQERRRQLPRGDTVRPPLVIVANTLIFIYSSVVMTLLGTHVAPLAGVNCGLDQRWRYLFTHKRDEAIRTIQMALSCCGYSNSHDQAWPFPDKSHDAHACERAFGQRSGCIGPWRQEEQRVAGILMAVVGLVFVWQFAIIATPTRRESWLHQVLPERVSRMIADEEHGNSNGPRRAIDYLPDFSRYRDQDRHPVAEEIHDNDDDEDATSGIVDRGVQQIRNALPGTEHEPERHVISENEWARG